MSWQWTACKQSCSKRHLIVITYYIAQIWKSSWSGTTQMPVILLRVICTHQWRCWWRRIPYCPCQWWSNSAPGRGSRPCRSPAPAPPRAPGERPPPPTCSTRAGTAAARCRSRLRPWCRSLGARAGAPRHGPWRIPSASSGLWSHGLGLCWSEWSLEGKFRDNEVKSWNLEFYHAMNAALYDPNSFKGWNAPNSFVNK